VNQSAPADARRFLEAVDRHHPDPFRAVARDALERDAEHAAAVAGAGTRGETVCALMRLGALLGERNGHSGIFALDDHARPLSFYPVRLYEFEDGVFVVSAADPALVGAEVLSIGGVEIASLASRIAALVPRDNDSTIRARRPSYLVAAEVLEGLGIGDGTRQVFVVRTRAGDTIDAVLDPVPAAQYVATVDTDRRLPRWTGVRYLERRDEPAWVEQVAGGKVIVVAYNVTRGETEPLAAEIASIATREAPLALVLDLRHNGGGDNTTYGPLLRELERQAEAAHLLVLTSRVTFSAAMQLVVDLESRTNARFVGEATGASPNHFGDAIAVELPTAGLTARVATIHWETAGEDARLTREPDLGVALRSGDFFDGRDPVLEAALAAVLDPS
jgi:hypothetical protein